MDCLFLGLEATERLPAFLRPLLPQTLWVKGTSQDLVDSKSVALWGVDIAGSGAKIPLLSERAQRLVSHFDVVATINGIIREEYRVPPVRPYELSAWGKWVRHWFRPFPHVARPSLIPFPAAITPFPVCWLVELAKATEKSVPHGVEPLQWPKPYRVALTVSYNIESDWIYRHAEWFGRFASLNTTYGLKSVWFCSPKKSESRSAKKGMEKLRGLGVEIGCLGFNGDGRIPYLQDKGLKKRLDQIQKFSELWSVKGFRSEWCLTSPVLLSKLAPIFSYDSSLLADTEWFTSISRAGVGHAFPFHLDGCPWEIPVTLPLGISRADMGCAVSWFWDRQLERARRVLVTGGLIHVVLHPAPLQSANDEAFNAIEGFFRKLLELCSPWRAAPDEIATWARSQKRGEEKLKKAA